MKLTNILATSAALAMAFTFQPLPAAATQVSAEEDGKRKINISGRQRMLSQRMAKAACFAAMDVNRAAHIAMATKAHQEFDIALKGLREGSADLGMLPESGPAIVAELSAVEELWATYGPAVASVADGGAVGPDVIARVAELSLPTLVQMNKAVGAFEKRYGGSDLHPALALAINVSGRQRMLSQKSSKEFCLLLSGIEVEANRDALTKTVALFESALAALMDGDDALGLPEAPTDEIYEQLELVQGLWTPMAEILKAAMGGATPSAEDIAFVAERNNEVLVEMNKAVGMYARL